MIVSYPSQTPSSSCPGVELAQYLLVCHARNLTLTQGVWFFSLETLAGQPVLEAEDEEEGDLNRLSLLAAVRGLEAIDGSSRVSLVSNNRYLIRSLDQSLPRWRENAFVWEHFGRKIPVQNADLWRRIDRTLAIHDVTASLVQTTRISGQQRASLSEWPAREVQRPPVARSERVDSPAADTAMALSRIDSGHRGTVSPRADRLRRWLAGQEGPVVNSGRRGRYRPEDWSGEEG